MWSVIQFLYPSLDTHTHTHTHTHTQTNKQTYRLSLSTILAFFANYKTHFPHTQDHFSDIGVYAQELINATTFTMDMLQNMSKEGFSPPRIVLLLGLDNGPTEPFSCLLEEVRFVVFVLCVCVELSALSLSLSLSLSLALTFISSFSFSFRFFS